MKNLILFKHLHVIAVIMLFTWTSCRQDNSNLADEELYEALSVASDNNGVDYYRLPDSNDYESIPSDPRNSISADKVALGKLLFHDSGFGINCKQTICSKTYSCSSCHSAKAGFQAGVLQGISDGGRGYGNSGEGRTRIPSYPATDLDVQPIRTPSAMNMAYQTNILWNGQFGAHYVNEGTEYSWTVGTPKEKNNLGYQGLETQAIAGIGVHRLNVDAEIINHYGYKPYFDQSFGEVPEQERYTAITAGLAIAAYERTVLANQSPFQLWLRGNENAMDANEKQGALLFFGKAKCYACHNGPALNAMAFYGLGMNDLIGSDIYASDQSKPEHKGRGGFTNRTEDMYKFKVPQLYNLKDSPFYGHGGSFRTVYDVVKYKNNAIPQNANVPASQLAQEFEPLKLTEDEMQKIAKFIENGLYDPSLMRYQPNSVLSGSCIPNNDTKSKVDLGCQ